MVLMVSIGLADSLNPSTIAPALYLASGERPRSRVAEFTLVGVRRLPGRGSADRARARVADPRRAARPRRPAHGPLHGRDRRRRPPPPGAGADVEAAPPDGRAGHARIEPEAQVEHPPRRHDHRRRAADRVPLFRRDRGHPRIWSRHGARAHPAALFNVCFILPLLGILLTLVFARDRADRILMRGREYLERRWPHMSVRPDRDRRRAWRSCSAPPGWPPGIHGRVGRFFRHVAPPAPPALLRRARGL